MLTFLYRYRISGSSLLAAMDQSSLVAASEKEQSEEASQPDVNRETHINGLDSSHMQGNEEKSSRAEERSTRGQPTVDIAEVLRRWTHALQRIHKQSLQLVCLFIL